jgi:hypothetical protein
MPDHEVTIVERLARQICKTLQDVPGLRAVDLQDEVGRHLAQQRSTVSGVWRRKSAPRPGDFDKAVALAIEKGWLQEKEGILRLTDDGKVLARRSRAGPRRSRTGLQIGIRA